MTGDDFEAHLRDALAHLHDPDYAPPQELCVLLGCDLEGGAFAVQSAAIRAIESLKPPPSEPPSTQMSQAYALLHMRFVQGLTQEETAYRMHMSLSTIRRAQRAAVHTLARLLWERSQQSERPAALSGRDPVCRADDGPDWREQIRQELAALQARSPDAVSDVAETIEGALEVAEALTAAHGVRVRVGALQPDLIAAIHPNALRQILIAAIGRIARLAGDRDGRPAGSGPAGGVTIFARLEQGNVRISLASTLAGAGTISEADLVRDIPAPEGVALEAHAEGNSLFLWVDLPPVGRMTVLVVDDNQDMVRFYRRATDGTGYHIVQVSEGRSLFDAIQTHAPDAVVLDVMLPDVDGWELLMRMHEDAATRQLPVIVCSVVREEELALSLGARVYLAKPVRHRQFIEALDECLRPPPTAGPTAQGNNAAAC